MKKMMRLLAALQLAMGIAMVSCSAEDTAAMRVGGLKGPTGMALAHMMTENTGAYEFTLAGAPDELTGQIIQGNVDVSAVPVNLGAVLYNKTQGGVQALSLITRGMLYVLEKGDSIQSVADL